MMRVSRLSAMMAVLFSLAFLSACGSSPSPAASPTQAGRSTPATVATAALASTVTQPVATGDCANDYYHRMLILAPRFHQHVGRHLRHGIGDLRTNHHHLRHRNG